MACIISAISRKMKYTFHGSLKNLSAIVENVNKGRGLQLFPSNEITKAKLQNGKLVLRGVFYKGVGRLMERENAITVVLKVRLRKSFVFMGCFALILLSRFIWGENVTINGDSDPELWKRIGLVCIGLVGFIAIPGFILRRLRNDFGNKIENLIKYKVHL